MFREATGSPTQVLEAMLAYIQVIHPKEFMLLLLLIFHQSWQTLDVLTISLTLVDSVCFCKGILCVYQKRNQTDRYKYDLMIYIFVLKERKLLFFSSYYCQVQRK